MKNKRYSLAFVSAMARTSSKTVEGSSVKFDVNTSDKFAVAYDKERHKVHLDVSKEANCAGRAMS